MERQSDDIRCNKCKKNFNTNDREPLMLPCGHTCCSTCIQKLSSKNLIICPENSKHSTSLPISNLPKNYELLNQLWKSRSQEPKNLCNTHKKTLDYLCVSDKTKICADCALFGTHKNHDIRQLQASINEIAVKAVYLIGMSQEINHGLHEYLNDQNKAKIEQIYQEFQIRKRIMETDLREGFQKMRNKLNETEKQSLNMMKRNFEFIEYHMVACRDIPYLIDTQAEKWKLKVDEKLKYIINHAGDSNFLPIDLLENEATELLETGNMIVKDMESLKDMDLEFVEGLVNQIDVEFKEELLYNICDIRPNINKIGVETDRRTIGSEESHEISFEWHNDRLS